ncbi:alanine racemase C-terminal domain-containing protein [Microbacterium aquimaris]|uniref:alanine racemase C-terminal domain-containing protein n=1 Tax=Microbacterium aquimaris TaxID=459816 RepID=UPI002AD4B93E|nr:alanine racemase C-terminal domain-containing protein [Microbacterium aquimaris]MDZ8274364.1 alanine racemase C-terminal domain-containing protein [Microbacterium aquimaris]
MTTAGLSVEVSRGALVAGARALVADDGVPDLRRDAWGHGLDVAMAALGDAGIARACVDPADAARAASFGLEPRTAPEGDSRRFYGLRGRSTPAMRAMSVVVSTKPLRAGEGVSYGYTHRAAADTWIGLVAGGYGQGVARALGNRASIAVEGMMRPVVGRIAMDVCVVDLGPEGEHLSPGAEACLFGGDGPARHNLHAWAEATGWSPVELAGIIGASVPRRRVA